MHTGAGTWQGDVYKSRNTQQMGSRMPVGANAKRERRLNQYEYNCYLQTMLPPSDDSARLKFHQCLHYNANGITNTIYGHSRNWDYAWSSLEAENNRDKTIGLIRKANKVNKNRNTA